MPYKDPERQRAFTRQWMADRRWQGIQYLGGKCAHCGAAEDLEIDHIDPAEKAYCTGGLWSYRWETIYEELDKCQLLCHGCHARKTALEGFAQGRFNKLAEEEVVQILHLLADGNGMPQIAKWYGVHRRTINDIALGHTWKHVAI